MKRTVRVKTTQHILPDLDPVEGFPMREWSIELVQLDKDNNEIPLSIVDRVVYHLHPTFANPNRKFTEPPFKIIEQGWGGFPLNISLFLVDKGGERKITHDLNFLKEEYEVDHVISAPININKPKLMKELAKSGLVPSKESLTGNKRKSSSVSSSTTSSSRATTATTNANTSNNKSSTSSGASEPRTKKSKITTQPMIKGSIDIERLAFGMTKLKDDDLVEIVHIVTNNTAPGMNFNNNTEEGEFTMDLLSLPESLLQLLWDYVKAHAEKKDNRDKEKEEENEKEITNEKGK